MVPDRPVSRRRRVSVVVPVCDAQATLAALDDRISTAFADRDVELEVVYVDDRSTDGSGAILQELADRPGRQVRRLPARRGQHGALVVGFLAATGDVIVTIDDDLQHPPEVAVPLCDVVADGAVDLVYVSPDASSISASRQRASALIRAVLGIALGSTMGAAVSPFRVFDARLARHLMPNDSTAPSVDLLIGPDARTFASTTFPASVTSGDAAADPRRSRYTIVSLLRLACRMTIRALAVRVRHGRGRAVRRVIEAPAPSGAGR
ncbi:MAG: glycosyltransferase family 2 protein [Aquihabitans sp.]